jgi:hypothetical protein
MCRAGREQVPPTQITRQYSEDGTTGSHVRAQNSLLSQAEAESQAASGLRTSHESMRHALRERRSHYAGRQLRVRGAPSPEDDGMLPLLALGMGPETLSLEKAQEDLGPQDGTLGGAPDTVLPVQMQSLMASSCKVTKKQRIPP